MDASRIISEDEARQILEPHYGRLRACHRWAWEQWEDKTPEEQLLYSPRSRASFIHDCIVSRAQIEFAGLPGVKMADDHGFLVLVFEDVVMLRFKKFRDRNLGTCGIATQQQQRFALQQPPISGFPIASNVVSGYLLDELQASMSMVAITCSVGSNLQWFIDITEDDAASGGSVQPAPQIGPSGPRGPRVRSASEEEEDTEEASDE